MDNQPTGSVPNQTPPYEQAPPPPQAQSAPPAAPAAKPPKSHKLLKTFLVLLLIIVVAGATGAGGYVFAKKKGDQDKTELDKQITALQANTHDLPADAVKLSDCVPNMGSHYVAKGGDPIYGPLLLVNHSKRVIGVEYMASTDMYTPIPGIDPPLQLVQKWSPMFNWKFDHFQISHMPKGHEGFPKDHIDTHIYTVSEEQQKLACIK